MPRSKDALYISVSGFETKFMASFSILTGILSAPGDFELSRAFIARSTYATFTGCSLNLVPPVSSPRYLRGSSEG